MQLLDHGAAQAVLREHAPDRLLDDERRLARQQRIVARAFDPTGIPGVAVGDLFGFLTSGELDLRGVHHDHVVAGVHMGGEDRLVLAPEDGGDLRRKAPEHLAAGIDHVPATHDVRGLRRVGLHHWRLA